MHSAVAQGAKVNVSNILIGFIIAIIITETITLGFFQRGRGVNCFIRIFFLRLQLKYRCSLGGGDYVAALQYVRVKECRPDRTHVMKHTIFQLRFAFLFPSPFSLFPQ